MPLSDKQIEALECAARGGFYRNVARDRGLLRSAQSLNGRYLLEYKFGLYTITSNGRLVLLGVRSERRRLKPSIDALERM